MTAAPATTTLTAFLEKRLADDERWAQMAGHGFGHQPLRAPRNAGWTDIDLTENVRPSYDAGFIERMSPARVLAQVAALGKIVELHSGDNDPDCTPWGRRPDGSEPCDTLAALAAVYADHPDYDPAWGVG